MGYVYLDAEYFHREIGHAAAMLEFEAACWTSREGTYRAIPLRCVEELIRDCRDKYYTMATVGELVAAGRWEVAAEGWILTDPLVIVDPDDKVLAPRFEELPEP